MLPVLEAEKSKIEAPARSGESLFLVLSQPLLTAPSPGGRGSACLRSHFHKGTNPVQKGFTLVAYTPPKGPTYQNQHTRHGDFKIRIWGVYKHSEHSTPLKLLPKDCSIVNYSSYSLSICICTRHFVRFLGENKENENFLS